jgi:nitrite reductase/ring-hydroxylating ferredoxin subunit/uncharacterized membrane protein
MGLAKRLDKLAGTIERAGVLDSTADKIASVAKKIFSPRAVTTIASGTPIGHPLHPLLVAVPIGSWTSAAVFDLVGEHDAARKLIGLGVLAAAPAAATGTNDWLSTSEGERRVGLVHAILNWVAIASYGASWLARRRGRRASGIAWSLVGASTVGASGWLGGHLAYALGIGVDTTAFQHSTDKWSLVAAEEEIHSGVLRLVDLDGVPVVLTRGDEGKIVALADRCTHRGGPLHQGILEDGCIVCPWHGSHFAFDGSVVAGPATRPAAAYEVMVAEGQVLIRRADEPRTLRKNPVGR